jgi:hypothetical protein
VEGWGVRVLLAVKRTGLGLSAYAAFAAGHRIGTYPQVFRIDEDSCLKQIV